MAPTPDIEKLKTASPAEFEAFFRKTLNPVIEASFPDLADEFTTGLLGSFNRDELLPLLRDDMPLQVKCERARDMFRAHIDKVYRYDVDFECGICCEDKEKGWHHYVLVAGDPVCRACYLSELKPKFLAALKDEDAYPVSWGNAHLDPTGFPELGEEFRRKWVVRVKEYQTPKAERIYCKHLYRLGKSGEKVSVSRLKYEEARRQGGDTGECRAYVANVQDVANMLGSLVECQTCSGGLTCWLCGQPTHPAEGEPCEHSPKNCDPSRLGKEETIDPSLVRGIDYQICPDPTCRRGYGLADGCNVMVCACRTHFCYICGSRAHHDGDHWAPGKPCPRWNQPGTRNAQQDHEEAPLVIPEHFRQLVERLRAQAIDMAGESPNFSNFRLDQAMCHELLGNCAARVLRRQEQERDPNAMMWIDVSWIPALQKILWRIIDAVYVYVYRHSMNRNDDIESLAMEIDGSRDRRKIIERDVKAFREAEPSVLDLLPALDPLFERYLELSSREIGELEKILKGMEREQEGHMEFE